MVASAAEAGLDGFFRGLDNFGNLFDRIAFHVKEQQCRALMLWQRIESSVECLIAEGGVGPGRSGNGRGFGVVDRNAMGAAVVDKAIVGYAKNPCFEIPRVFEVATGEKSFDEGLLRNVVGKLSVSAAESCKKAAKLSLTALNS